MDTYRALGLVEIACSGQEKYDEFPAIAAG